MEDANNEGKNKTNFIVSSTQSTTITYIVSASETSPKYNMCARVSVTINGEQTPHTVTVVKKASRKYACQVFYHWEGVNWWKMIFAFFPEDLLDVS